MRFIKKIKKIKNILITKTKESKFNNAKLTDLALLSYDIPVLITNELYSHNDFYFHSYNLKKFCGFSEKYQLKAAIEHGVFWGNYHWDWDIKNNLSGIITMGQNRKQVLEKVTNKQHYAIGPFIAYAKHYLSDTQLEQEKQRLGRNLLVFPMHSTHWVDVNYNIEELCKQIKEISKNFDSVRVCLYWKDIRRGTHKIYEKYGFECISAGHIYDKNFTPRLKSIIETSTMTMSNGIGTHVGYCIHLNKPHYIINQEYSHSINNLAVEKETRKALDDEIKESQLNSIYNAFGEYKEEITQEQKEIIDRYWGLYSVKTKQELIEVFQEYEDLYKKGNR